MEFDLNTFLIIIQICSYLIGIPVGAIISFWKIKAFLDKRSEKNWKEQIELNKREFFKNQDVLTKALKNPKCNAEFAKNQMGNYGRTEQSKRALFSIARDAGNAEIKSLAQQKIKQHGWHFKVV